MSLVGWLVIIILLTAEINNYLTPRFKEHMVVDTSLGQLLRVNINITFHALTCNDVTMMLIQLTCCSIAAQAHLDAMDVAGDNQLNVEHEMIKQRLSKHGVPIGKAGVEIIGEGPLPVTVIPPDYCGPCYGAETESTP